MMSNGEAADPVEEKAVTDVAVSDEIFRASESWYFARKRVGRGMAPLDESDRKLAAFVAAIKAGATRELAARVLPVLEEMEDYCPLCSTHEDEPHDDDCALAALIAELRALSEETGGGTDE